MQATQALARFVADTRYTDLPASLIAELKIAVLDAMAAAYVGSSLPWAQRVVEMVHELGGAGAATAVNQPWTTDVSRAALANGAMIGAFECEPLTGSHASGTVLPAALAICERDRRSGKELLLALGSVLSGRLNRTAVGAQGEKIVARPSAPRPDLTMASTCGYVSNVAQC
jgi:2-methylcitrate dehydratase PrpD